MRFICDNSTDPYYNMALDEWCLLNHSGEELWCRLWQNAPSVIIGITQNPATEVNLKFLEDNGILLVRRSTGGGAVYHDLGNLNYSFFGPVDAMDTGIVENMAQVLRSLGADAEVSGRNDIFVGQQKVSGYAKRIWKDRAIIHGTLMYNVDIDTLTRVLDTPESKLHHKGVASVRSRVGNLGEMLPQFPDVLSFRDAVEAALRREGDRNCALSDEEKAQVIEIRDSKYATAEWIRGRF